MNWIFEDDRPIYIQLVEQLKTFIASGSYGKGDKLPSVRELALETKVNPNTMQKAFSELEASGLVNTQRTSGRFVTNDQSLLDQTKKEIAEKKTRIFLKEMTCLGLTSSEIVSYLKAARKEE